MRHKPRTFTVVALMSCFAAVSSGRALAQEPLRLEQAIRQALVHNEKSRKAPYRVEQSVGALDRARGAFFPTLTASGSSASHVATDRGGRATTTTSSVTLNQPLVSLSAFPLYSQASHQLESERWGAVQNRRTVAFDTAKAFLNALTEEKVFQSAQQRLQRAKDNLADAEARAAAGLASVNDATKSRLELTTAEREVVQSQGRLANAYLALGFLVARPVAPPLAEPDKTVQAAQSFERDPESQIKAALDKRPDLRSAHEKTEALEASAAEPYYRMAPTLSAALAIRALPFPANNEQATDETGTLNLTWNIFDAGFRYADLKTRRAALESQRLDESFLRRTVDNDVRTAFVTLKAARETYRVALDAVKSATQNTEETQILYKQGLARGIELVDATSKQFDAEVTRAESKLTLEQAYIDLRFALGLAPTDDPEVAMADGGAVK